MKYKNLKVDTKTLCIVTLAFLFITGLLFYIFIDQIQQQEAFNKKHSTYLLDQIEKHKELYKRLYRKYEADCLSKDIINSRKPKIKFEYN